MNPETEPKRQMSSLSLNFILLGGGIAWVLHLFLTYAIGEFGCVGGLGNDPDFVFLGIQGIAWMLLAASAVPIALSVVSVLVARHTAHELQESMIGGEEISRQEIHLVRAGVIVNGLFVLIIVVQTIPVFFYLQGC